VDTSVAPLDPTAIRTLVHKRFPENVLLTEIRARAEDHFVCTGRIPTDHRFFNDRGRTPRADIFFYTEVGRQASLAVTHAFLNAGLDDVFIFERSQAMVTPTIWNAAALAAAETVHIEITVRETVRRKNVVTHVVAEHFMSVGDEHVFRGTGTWTIQSAALFARLRRSAVEAATRDGEDPGAPGGAAGADPLRPYPSNLVITVPDAAQDRAAVTASLIVDRTHPYFFDHPCDHVPGMLLLEGCAQLSMEACAHAGAIAPPQRMAIMDYEMDFTHFVECGVPTTLTARVNTDGDPSGVGVPIDLVVSQRDIVAGTARITVGFPA
jgi:hypothetical protein